MLRILDEIAIAFPATQPDHIVGGRWTQGYQKSHEAEEEYDASLKNIPADHNGTIHFASEPISPMRGIPG